MTCSLQYNIPVDPSNKLALSLHYFSPSPFTSEFYFEPFNRTDSNGNVYNYGPTINWGDQMQYYRLITDFELMKNKLP